MDRFKRNKKGFLAKFDNMIMLALTAKKGKGEDNYYCCGPDEQTDRAVVGVFDGSGGLGSRAHKEMSGFSEAYLSSRALSGALHDWYHDHKDVPIPGGRQLTESIRAYFMDSLRVLQAHTVENARIRGALVRSFPATAAIAIAEDDPGGIKLHVIWVGDSRVYILNRKGLAQITTDDVATTDALENLTSDSAMQNVVSADGMFTMNYRCLPVEEPSLVFAATDGCYGYLPTPMEFELEMLDALCRSQVPGEFRDRLIYLFDEVAGDDSTLTLMSFMFGSFKEQKKKLQPRLEELYEMYLNPLYECRDHRPDQEYEFTRKVWERYRIGYERYMRYPGGE